MSNSPEKRTPLDWESARKRLEQLRESSERAGPGVEQVAAAYRKRAELLSRPLQPAGELFAAEAIVIFRIGSERFAVPLSRVSEILPNLPCAKVPGAPLEVAGVIQVRGEIRPVCELSRILGLPGNEKAGPHTVLLLRGAVREFGVRIDSVEAIRVLADEERRAAPEPFARHASWITRDLIPVLNIDSLFEVET